VPELVEVEAYRRLALAEALGRRIDSVQAPDAWYLKGGLTGSGVRRALTGRRLVGARRVGKLLLLDTDDGGPTVGLRFGMSGRLVVDGRVGMDRLIYTSGRRPREWDRFGLRFADGGHLRVNDPRRLGGVSLDPQSRGWALTPSMSDKRPWAEHWRGVRPP